MCEATARFAGLSELGAGLVTFAGRFEPGRVAAWARIGAAGAVASVTVASVLQAVDGVALTVAVDRWVASEEARRLAYEAACALRWIETGVAGLLGILSGRSPRACSTPHGLALSALWTAWGCRSRRRRKHLRASRAAIMRVLPALADRERREIGSRT
jgi:hypothetical protein